MIILIFVIIIIILGIYFKFYYKEEFNDKIRQFFLKDEIKNKNEHKVEVMQHRKSLNQNSKPNVNLKDDKPILTSDDQETEESIEEKLFNIEEKPAPKEDDILNSPTFDGPETGKIKHEGFNRLNKFPGEDDEIFKTDEERR